MIHRVPFQRLFVGKPSKIVFDLRSLCRMHNETTVEVPNETVTLNKRIRIRIIQKQSVKESILNHLQTRNDECARAIVDRVNLVPDLVAAGARYHSKCSFHYVFHNPPKGIRGRPFANETDKAMEDIYSYLEENSSECQFSLKTLQAQVTGGYHLHAKTVQRYLIQKYGDDILIVTRKGTGTMVCSGISDTNYYLTNFTRGRQRILEKKHFELFAKLQRSF